MNITEYCNYLVEFKGFWRCCITLKITGFMDFFNHQEF
jgi:hypothetical protein